MKKKALSLVAEALLCTVFLFISCENFLEGTDFKSTLDKKIEYANADKLNIRILLDSSDYGSVYPQTFTGAKGDSFNIEFSKSKDAVLRKITCKDSSGNNTNAVSLETIESDDDNKIVIKATINSTIAGNLEIKPICYLRTETTAPTCTDFFCKRSKDCQDDFDERAFSVYATSATNSSVVESIYKNHVNSFYVNCKATDYSGISCIKVKEELIYYPNGKPLTVPVIKEGEIEPSSTTETSAIFDTNYNFVSYDEGVVRITLNLVDNAGNETFLKQLDLIKDSQIADCNPELTGIESNYSNDYSKEIFNFTFIINNEGSFIYDLDGNIYNDTSNIDTESPFTIKITGIYYGYDKNNLEYFSDILDNESFYAADRYKPEKKRFTLYSIERDFSKDFYICPIVKDSAGNTKTKVIKIPAATDNYIKNAFIDEGYLNLVYNSLVNDVTNDRQELSYSLVDTDGNLYTFSNNEFNENYQPHNSTEKGFYDFSSSYYFTSNKKFATFLDGIYTFTYKNYPCLYLKGGISTKTFKLIKNGNSLISDLTQSDVPDFDITIDEFIPNTPKRHITVNINETLEQKEKNLSYSVYISGGNGPYTYGTLEFDIEAGFTYTLQLLVSSGQNGAIFSEQTITLDLDYDCVAPDCFEDFYNSYQNCTLNVQGEESNWNINENEKGEVYYIVSAKSLTLEEFLIEKNNNNVSIKEFDPEFPTLDMDINFNGLTGGYLNWYVEDIKKNYYYKSYNFKLDLYEGKIEKIDESNLKFISIDYPYWDLTEKTSNHYEWFYMFYLSKSGDYYKWQFVSQKSSESKDINASTKSINFSLNDASKTSFVLLSGGYPWGNGLSRIKNTYVYWPYLTGEVNVNYKDFSEGTTGSVIKIMSNAPCFAQTYYSNTNMGESQEDIDKWELMAKRCNSTSIQYGDSSFDYIVPQNSIPKSYYYCTVIYYADGSKMLTTIRQK